MSALDTEPPEMPDSPEADDTDQHHHSTFDKFGTFQSQPDFDMDAQSSGISSLSTPYGGFDDVTEASTNQRGGARVAESQSAASFEFTGAFVCFNSIQMLQNIQ